MNDQITLLRDGIPLGIWLLLAAIAVAAVTSILATVLRSGPGTEKSLRITAGALSVLGLIVAGYVVYKTQFLHEIPQCAGGGGGCTLVEQSDYSELAGIHVSIFGLIGYALILAATIRKDDLARMAAFVLSFFGFGFSMYLTYLELWDIKGICQWCVASAVVMTVLFAVNTARVLSFYGLDEESGS